MIIQGAEQASEETNWQYYGSQPTALNLAL